MVTQNVGRRTPCKLEFQAKMGETPRLTPENKARVGRSERSTVKCSATSSDGDVIKLFDEDGWLIDRYVAQKDPAE